MATQYEELLKYAINSKKSWLYYMPEGCYINFDLLVDYHDTLSKYFDELKRTEPQKAEAIINEYERIIEEEDILFDPEDIANIINEIHFKPYKDFLIEILNNNVLSKDIDEEKKELQENIINKINENKTQRGFIEKDTKEVFLISYLLCKYNEYLEKYVEISLRDFLKENETVKNICDNLSNVELNHILKRTQVIMKHDIEEISLITEKDIIPEDLSKECREILMEMIKRQDNEEEVNIEEYYLNRLSNHEKDILKYAAKTPLREVLNEKTINKIMGEPKETKKKFKERIKELIK